MKTALLLSGLMLATAPACTSCSSNSTAVKEYFPEITLPNPGIAVALRVEVQDAAHVLAHLRLTNHTPQVVWLYKPLLGEGPQWEECFFVLRDTPEVPNLPYKGPHAERYLGGQTHPLIFVVPSPDPTAFLQLAPGAVHEITKNLSEVFDFEHNRGEFLLSYGSLMPAMSEGKQRLEADSTHSKQLEPVYYAISSGNPDDKTIYREKFTVR